MLSSAAIYLLLLGVLVWEARLSMGCQRTTPAEDSVSVRCEARNGGDWVVLEYNTRSMNLTMTCESGTYSCSTLSEARSVFGMSAAVEPVQHLIVINCSLNAPLLCPLTAVNANDTNALVLKNITGELLSDHVVGLKSVQMIYMLDTNHTWIPYTLQTYLPVWSYYSVWGGNFHVREDTNQSLPDLTWLDLRNTSLGELTAWSFKSTPNMAVLQLSDTGIQSVDRDAFKDLSGLKQLCIIKNNITALEVGTFSHLSSLEYLALGWNFIRRLPSRIFSDLSELTELYMHDNLLESLESRCFSGLKSLTFLTLSDNELSQLGPSAFDGLPALKQLNLMKNKLASLHPTAFEGLIALTQLTLSDNYLTILSHETFHSLSSLERLWIDHNRLHIPDELSPFRELSGLVQLDLQHNQLTHVCSDWRHLPKLQYLDLSHNKITRLEHGDIQWNNSADVDFSRNYIINIRFKYTNGRTSTLVA